MATYIITGGTGFLGRHVLTELLRCDTQSRIHVLVRQGSVARLESLTKSLEDGDRVTPLIGDLTAPNLGVENPPAADHVLHLGAIYDLTAGEEQADTNVAGTRAVIDLARQLGATLHHVSSIAVAGDHRGRFSEADFDLGQRFPTPYHRTKFEAEKLVREAQDVRTRIYRPAAVVGSSVTGEIDKIDGPYYLFPAFAALAKLPAVPVAIPNLGATNIVPVDYVARALVRLMTDPHGDGRTYHLVNPRPQPVREIYSALAKVSGAPRAVAGLPGALVRPFVGPASIGPIEAGRALALKTLGIPPVLLDNMTLPTEFVNDETRKALEGTGIEVPEFGEYAEALWTYWREHLDPDRARRADARGPLVGRHVVITGASSGIGRSSALAIAREGATVLLLARRAEELEAVVDEIRAVGGKAHGYPCDITDTEAVDRTIARILDEHQHVDMLVNNAGRSIRRGIYHATNRLHDYERTMAVNYFGAVRLILALLPQMRTRRFGHVVNISSAGVQSATPRFSAYVASKSALDGFTNVVAAETLSDGITFTTIHMPLVRTPMIAPTAQYNAGPAASPEDAARMVVRALVERPKRIDVAIGTLGEFGYFFAPRTKDLALHQLYKMFPDSPAARGEPSTHTDATKPAKQGSTIATPPVIGNVLRRVGNLIPGVYW